MINLFRSGTLFTALFACIVLLLTHLPIITIGIPLIVPELEWMLVGERMSRGFTLYTQTWSDLSPLSALVYWILDFLFGRSQLAYQMMALLIVTLQAIFFNYSLGKHQLYPEKTSLPVVLYVLFMGLFFDFFTLSPMLMGVTFLILAIDGIFTHISEDAHNDEVFSIGFYIGIATLFYLPLGVFVGFALVSFLLLAATRVRKYLLMLFGFGFPLSLAALFFYMINGWQDFYFSWLMASLDIRKVFYLSFFELLLIASPFVITLLLAALQLFGGDVRFIHYQVRCQQCVVLWLLFAAVCVFFMPTLAPYQLILFVPPVVFFGTHYFILARRKLIAEIVFIALIAGVFLINYGNIYHFFNNRPFVDLESMVVKPVKTAAIQQKKLLVVGQGVEIGNYKNNIPATPYLNWQLAERHFNYLDNYEVVTEMYENFKKDLPDIIIDQNGKVAAFFNRVPALARHYQKSNANTYTRRENAKNLGQNRN